jgi:hypothetical protein
VLRSDYCKVPSVDRRDGRDPKPLGTATVEASAAAEVEVGVLADQFGHAVEVGRLRAQGLHPADRELL